MTLSERRRFRRVPMPIQIQAESGGGGQMVQAENISIGGMLIRASKTMEEAQRVTLRFTLPGTQREIRVEGTVLHVSPNAFMGVRFDKLSAADEKAIEEFVNSKDSI